MSASSARKSATVPEADQVLRVEDLTVSFATETGRIRVVENVSFAVERGQTVGLVGESGCGKSVTAMSIMRLLPSPPSHVEGGRVFFNGTDLLTLSDAQMRRIRGNRIGMIFQEPMTSLNPVFSVGFQIAEVLQLHRAMRHDEARQRAVELLEMVGIGAARSRVDQYPHQLSGGLRQRVMIAMALACGPSLLIADEPSTALDVTIQAQILDLLLQLKEEMEMSILMITHDLGVVAGFCEDVVVMYAGKMMEKASTVELFRHPMHPYTRGLLASIPKLGNKSTYLPTIPGVVPGPDQRPEGCYFADRCQRKITPCSRQAPPLEDRRDGHLLACWNPYE